MIGRLVRRARRAVNGPRPAILLYHRVARPALDPWRLAIAPEDFAAQMDWLVARRTLMPLDAFVSALFAGTLPANAAAITFDDGYADNLHAAAPILAARGLPATLFVASGSVGAPAFWWDALAAVMLGPSGAGLAAYRREWRRWQGMTPAARADALSALPAPPESTGLGRPLTEVELRAAAQTFTIGAHGVSHTPLPDLAPAEGRAELATGASLIETLLGARPAGLAYPHGAWDEASRQWVAGAGYAWAVTVDGTPVLPGADRFALPRIAAPRGGADALARRLAWAGA